ncbi:MAG: hypothetical protein ACJZ49_07190 [Candidatus Thalassarchaeaceae archaeon]|nr:MAG: hypothetical protein CMA04_001080 [Euryarchaeota archaeon]RPG76433.1 MAG: hypothetical protein CBC45_000875 [Euryarchaeota archaeon TMED85]|tara:strand:+ start:20121 stop:20597 length:477 start_codon:yes stop_codon:yes gene_type:complete
MGGGGTSEPIPIWDLSSLMGSIMLIGTILMALWVPSQEVNLDENEGLVDLMSIDVGFLGSDDAIEISIMPGESCIQSNSTCVFQADVGGEILVFNFESDGSWTSMTSTRTSDGPLDIAVSGSGEFDVKISVKRQLPLEAIPAILGLFLLVWGEWRRRQ